LYKANRAAAKELRHAKNDRRSLCRLNYAAIAQATNRSWKSALLESKYYARWKRPRVVVLEETPRGRFAAAAIEAIVAVAPLEQ
jgi:hypothetical protein